MTDPLLAAQDRVVISVDNQASLRDEDINQAVSWAGERPAAIGGPGHKRGRLPEGPGKRTLLPFMLASRLQLEFSVTNDSPKRVFLRLLGARSLTPRPDGLAGGRVTVLGRGSAPPTIASVDAGIDWVKAAAEKVLILPTQAEWNDLAAKAGTP